MPDISQKAVAVLTADAVSSRRIPVGRLESRTTEIAGTIEGKYFGGQKTFEFYRGDSFQALVEDVSEALFIALLWRAAMRATPDEQPWDIRVAIGIGSIDHKGSTLAASGGPGFHYSGTLLDEIKRENGARIAFRSDDAPWDEILNMECLLVESLIDRWSPAAAEAVYQQMLSGDTQEDLAAKIGVSQPAIHKRLQTASWPAIRKWEAHYRKTAQQKFTGTQAM